MLKHFSARECGRESAHILRDLEIARRTYALDLCTKKDIKHNHESAVTTLDIDHSENR